MMQQDLRDRSVMVCNHPVKLLTGTSRMFSVWLVLSVLSWGELAGGGPSRPWRRPIGAKAGKLHGMRRQFNRASRPRHRHGMMPAFTAVDP